MRFFKKGSIHNQEVYQYYISTIRQFPSTTSYRKLIPPRHPLKKVNLTDIEILTQQNVLQMFYGKLFYKILLG